MDTKQKLVYTALGITAGALVVYFLLGNREDTRKDDEHAEEKRAEG